MDIQKIEELIKILQASSVNEITVCTGGSSVHIKKGARVFKKSAQTVEQKKSEEKQHPKEQFITAPMVGIFHVADSIAQPGARVEQGQVVGAIESMKLMNDVTAQVSGIVREVLVEDGIPVEYGQPLYRIEVDGQ
ncbi:MAG: acetyl-CoA carboxylase biotin carboxyl carrier protein [Armatimonadota bacterium]